MSELKCFYATDGEVSEIPFIPGFAYPKAEADKVIAEKDEEISALKHVINMADAEYFKLKHSIDGCRQEIAELELLKAALESRLNSIDTPEGLADLERIAFDERTATIRAEKAARHQKYKRCLAMACWCESKVYHIRRTPLCDMDEHEYWQYENDFWQRWQKRWLELA